MTTPSELLTQAADLIRDAAAAATPGPWRQHDCHLLHGGHTASVLSGKGNDTELRAWLPTFESYPWGEKRNVWNDARWIALLNPAVAAPLEAMLRGACGMWRVYENRGWSTTKVEAHVGAEHRAALALAKALLGTPEEEET